MPAVAEHPTFSVLSACCSRVTASPSSEVVLSSMLAQSPGPWTSPLGLSGGRAENTRQVGIALLITLRMGKHRKALSLQTGCLSGETKARKGCIAKGSWEEPSGTLPRLDPQRKTHMSGINGSPREHHGQLFSSPNPPSAGPAQDLIAFWRMEG